MKVGVVGASGYVGGETLTSFSQPSRHVEISAW